MVFKLPIQVKSIMDKSVKIFSGSTLSFSILILFLFLYLIFPSGFSTTDGWNYAAEIKNSGEMFHPYHLLYNWIGYLFCLLPVKAGADTLVWLKVMNSVFAVLSLYVIQIILRNEGKGEKLISIITSLTGFSFSILRYSTENETYIIPLFFSLLSIFFSLTYFRSGDRRSVIWASVTASFSILFHITYIFFWLALLIVILQGKKWKDIILYCAFSLIVPAIYLIVIFNLSGKVDLSSVIGFIAGDARQNASFGISAQGIFFSAMNFVRSFIQIHGYIINMIKTNILLMVPGVISLVLFAWSLPALRFLKNGKRDNRVSRLFLLIIILQFLFALISFGNAEFMVMIPVMAFLLIGLAFNNQERLLIRVLSGMMIWNISYGIVPLHFNRGDAGMFLCSESLKNERPVIITSDDQLLKSIIYYTTGSAGSNNIFRSPALLEKGKPGTINLAFIIDSTLQRGGIVLTDCLGDRPISRATLIEGDENRKFFQNYRSSTVRKWQSFAGEKTISRIERLKE